MFKTFVAGVVLGAAALLGGAYLVQAVDQYREASIITVMPNGGNSEVFHINVPMDRIMAGAGAGDGRAQLPAELAWPETPKLAGIGAELFKIRNSRDSVVGVASRIAASGADGDTIEWVLHLPARGSVFVTMQPEPADAGYRTGELRAGTREFTALDGSLTERWIEDRSGAEDAPLGRIELAASFVATEAPAP